MVGSWVGTSSSEEREPSFEPKKKNGGEPISENTWSASGSHKSGIAHKSGNPELRV